MKALRECFFESLRAWFLCGGFFCLVLVLLCLVVWQGKRRKNKQ
ncbi:hypothetical protein LINPERHAP2_LOCUS23419 [Linum perenne]